MRYYILIGLTVLVSQMFGKIISLDYAKQVAENFYQAQFYNTYKEKSGAVVVSDFVRYNETQPVYYIFEMSDNGFIVLSADDKVFPVLGYSFQSKLVVENMPVQLQGLLDTFGAQIALIREYPVKSSYEKVWSNIYTGKHVMQSKENFKFVLPLLTTKWNQDDPYNNYCPEHPYGPNGRCYAGCVATAMAQVMKYYEYPVHGTGTHSYYWLVTNTVDLENTYYRWDEMTNTANITSEDAIAELMFHCGVAVDMNYGPYGSSGFTEWVPDALKNHFSYHPSLRYKERNNSNYTDIWDMLVRDNLDNQRPLIYNGSSTDGHAFVCDGYQDTCYYHFNWGWGGNGDGYFYYNDLTPAGNDFSYYQGAVFDIFPYYAPYCMSGRTLIEYERSFDDGSGTSYYRENTSCDWLINPDTAEYIELTFNYFDTEAGKDILYIYDGSNTSAQLLAQYSGNNIPGSIISSGNELYLQFVTDGQNQGQGWEISYSSYVTKVEELNRESFFKVFPNPADDVLIIEANQNCVVDIFNMQGQKLFSEEFSGKKHINISTLKSGVYFVKAKGSNVSYTSKLMVY